MNLRLTNSDNFAIIDSEDLEKVSMYNWYLNKQAGYVIATQSPIFLHRLILGISDPKIAVDHKDRNKLNNSKTNLRLCSKSENGMNRGKQKNNKTSKYKGVSFDSNRKKWRAYITRETKTMSLGRFNTEKEAAIAYNNAAQLYHGEFAFLNEVT